MDHDIILEMKHISKTFPGVLALDDVFFRLRRGEVHILLGENGAGKSTLMKILSGAYQKTSGEIRMSGSHVDIKSPKQAQQLGISTIYQELNLAPSLSAAENIFLGREPVFFAGLIDHKKMIAEAQRLLDELGVGINARLPVRELGIAQQQMVEVAKSLTADVKILIMDEPTSALTSKEIADLFAVVRRLRESGVSVIYISHRLEELFEIGDRVTVLRDGRQIATKVISDVTKTQLIRLMVDRELTEQFPKKPAVRQEELLRVESLSIRGKLRNISFALRKGEVLGVAGLLGSGRTDLARALFGLERLVSGKVFVHGQQQKITSPKQAINLGLAFLTEDRKSQGLILNLSVKDNILLPSIRKWSKFGVVNKKQEARAARSFVNSLGIKTPSLLQKVMFLSGGNQQKVVLSKWLCTQADIFIFDEPTRGIDLGAKVEIYHLMNQLTAKGAGIIMISSELPEILGMSDRVIVMCHGAINGEFSAENATQEKILQHALGQAHVN
ncbi:MAG: sugar ABC transporter ATP-binding protein [bacterium]